jgi:hypothetical protein
MNTHPQDTPIQRALWTGAIGACIAYLLHRALTESPLVERMGDGPTPSAAVVVLALLGVGAASAVLSQAYKRNLERPSTPQSKRHPHTLWSLALACALPIAQVDGTPLPAILVAAIGGMGGAWWTVGFGLLAVGVATAATRVPSGWITSTSPRGTWTWTHAVCAWGGWGTAALIAFPVAPELVLM